ncbi:MAG: hypothetical protein R3F11_23285 [Verrucomicrobiales bacterium]
MPWSERKTTSVSSAAPDSSSALSSAPTVSSQRRTGLKYSAISSRTSGRSGRNFGTATSPGR